MLLYFTLAFILKNLAIYETQIKMCTVRKSGNLCFIGILKQISRKKIKFSSNFTETSSLGDFFLKVWSSLAVMYTVDHLQNEKKDEGLHF